MASPTAQLSYPHASISKQLQWTVLLTGVEVLT